MDVRLFEGTAGASVDGEFFRLHQHHAGRLANAPDDDFRDAAGELHASLVEGLLDEAELHVALRVILRERALRRRSMNDILVGLILVGDEVLTATVIRRERKNDGNGAFASGRPGEHVSHGQFHFLRPRRDIVGDPIDITQPDDLGGTEHRERVHRFQKLDFNALGIVDARDGASDDFLVRFWPSLLDGLIVQGTSVPFDEVFVFAGDDGEGNRHPPPMSPPSPCVAILVCPQ